MKNIFLYFIIILLAFILVGTSVRNLFVVQEMRTELQLFKTALKEKTGIMVTPTTQSIDEAFNKAKSFIQQGQLATAALYFSNVWAKQPTFNLLQEYQQSLTQYCHYLVEQGDLETALQILVDMDNFARAQAPYFEISDIETLQKMLVEVETFKQTVEKNLIEKQPVTEIAEKSQVEAEIAKLVERTELFLKQAVNEPANSELTLYYLTSAQSIFQQLVLLEPEMNSVKTHVVKLSFLFEKTKQTISQNQSKVAWEEIQKGLQAIEVDKKGKAESAIQQLMKQRQFLAENANKLTFPEFLQKAQALMEEITTEITDWQRKQQRFYDQWAIEQVKRFYAQVQTRLGTVTDDKKGIAQDILSYLKEIDTRYLSLPVSTAYSEAFNMYYAKLDAETKLSLSTEMTLAKKRTLQDF